MIILTIVVIISKCLVGHNSANIGVGHFVVLAVDVGIVVGVVRPAMTKDGYTLVIFSNEVHLSHDNAKYKS